jgi:hypothetical protein
MEKLSLFLVVQGFELAKQALCHSNHCASPKKLNSYMANKIINKVKRNWRTPYKYKNPYGQ